jgi:hypothetical protein
VSASDAVRNASAKAIRRLSAVHKPIVRLLRRRARHEEHQAFAREAESIDRQIAEAAAGGGPIVAGPWLAEVGYEVLYWIPFLRWFADAFHVPPDRLVVLSRGGMEPAYAGIGGAYVDILDLLSPPELAARNAERQAVREGGGQKQSDVSPLDRELVRGAAARAGSATPRVLHPSLMFRLFRHAWHGNIPMDAFWRRTRYEPMSIAADALASSIPLPPRFTAAKIYTGPALGASDQTRRLVREAVARVAQADPVVLLSTDFGLDEHRDFGLDDLPGVVNLQPYLTPRTNLGVQLAIIARAQQFLGACGGLAWLAPFLGVPTVAMYDTDRLLAPHLLVARQAGTRAGAAEFSTLDLRALKRVGTVSGAGTLR